MTGKLAIWNALSKTDPKHTKQFKRAGGFSGTAIRPIWSIKMMTEQFGPCGVGWGMTKPEFQTVSSDGEILVYCTTGLWHGKPDNLVYGVGGDKVTAKRQSGTFNSDEAFKAAYTDALSNAMKMLGVGADVHMGLFDDHKYVRELAEEFREAEAPTTEKPKSAAPKQLDSTKAPAPGPDAEWKQLADTIKHEIDASLDTVSVADILASKPFLDLAKHSKKAAEFLTDRANKHIGVIMQGKAA